MLWRSWPGCAAQLQLLSYASVPQVVSSDHTPVHSAFALTLTTPRLEGRTELIPGLRLQLSELRAVGLPPHDANGLADPYVEVRPSDEASTPLHLRAPRLAPVHPTRTSMHPLSPPLRPPRTPLAPHSHPARTPLASPPTARVHH